MGSLRGSNSLLTFFVQGARLSHLDTTHDYDNELAS